MSPWSADWFLVGLAVGALATLALVVWVTINRAWRHAYFSGAPVRWPMILGMRLRGTPPSLIIDTYVLLVKRGRSVDINQVEAAYLANRSRHLTESDLARLVEEQPQVTARN